MTGLQWGIGAVCALLVVGLIAFIGYEAIEGTSLPPIVTVTPARVLAAGEGYVVEFRARNSGGVTARSLTVEGTLEENGRVVERASATLSFLPAHTEREGGLFFSRDPRKFELRVQPKGYDRP